MRLAVSSVYFFSNPVKSYCPTADWKIFLHLIQPTVSFTCLPAPGSILSTSIRETLIAQWRDILKRINWLPKVFLALLDNFADMHVHASDASFRVKLN